MYSIKNFCDDYCKKNSIKLFPVQEDILNQFYTGDYRELVAVLGRRSGKDFLLSLLAVYQTIQLLETKDPYKHYGIGSGNPIYNMMISASSDQARILFTQIKEIVHCTDYFKDKIESIEANQIYFLTSQDKAKQKQLLADGHDSAAKVKGSVVLISSYGTSDEILDKRIYSLLINDLGRCNGSRLWSTLAPATADFINPRTSKLDSKIIAISSPTDFMRKLYTTESDSRLSVKYATWEINEHFTESQLREERKFMSYEEFAVEFGAEFETKNETISFRLPGSTVNTLKRLAREIAFKEDKDYTYIDLIRSSIRNEVSRCLEP